MLLMQRRDLKRAQLVRIVKTIKTTEESHGQVMSMVNRRTVRAPISLRSVDL